MPSHPRTLFALIAIFCAALLGFGYYLEFALGEEPCPLCILQRLAFVGLFIVTALAAVHGAGAFGTRIYAGLTAIVAATGAAIGGRQVWLQSLPPDQLPECGPGLDYMLEVFPLMETLRMILTGSGECAEIGWTFLGLSIAGWSLIWFIIIILAAVYIFVKCPRAHGGA